MDGFRGRGILDKDTSSDTSAPRGRPPFPIDRGLQSDLYWLPPILGTLSTPPGDPESGDLYVIGCGATGEWEDRTGDLAYWDCNMWVFFSPETGATTWNRSRGYFQTFLDTEEAVTPVTPPGVGV